MELASDRQCKLSILSKVSPSDNDFHLPKILQMASIEATPRLSWSGCEFYLGFCTFVKAFCEVDTMQP